MSFSHPKGIGGGFGPKGTGVPLSNPRMADIGDENTGSLTLLSGRGYARYIGRWTGLVRSVDVHAYVSGAVAVGAGYCELALATSTASDLYAASVSLTIRAAASIDTAVKAGATANTRVQFSNLGIAPGTDLWAVVACAYATTQASFRTAGGGGGTVYGHSRQAAGPLQPSLQIGTAVAYTYTVGVANVCPQMRGEVR